MDANKLDKLKQINYTIQPCCGTCRYARISADGWGECKNNSYYHIKHSSNYLLSINRFGLCDRFDLDEGAEERLGSFGQFIEQNKELKPKRNFELED